MANAKALKDAYLEAKETNPDNTTYNFRQLQALRDMAKANVYPDGRFGDEECNIWSMFNMAYSVGREV